MKLFAEYVLVDPAGEIVLYITNSSPQHLRNMRDLYSVIYKSSLRIAALDVLGELHIIDLEQYEAR